MSHAVPAGNKGHDPVGLVRGQWVAMLSGSRRMSMGRFINFSELNVFFSFATFVASYYVYRTQDIPKNRITQCLTYFTTTYHTIDFIIKNL